MIETDIRTAILADATIAAIIGTRFFLKAPINQQTLPYLTYYRQSKTRNMVSEQNRFQIMAYSTDTKQLEDLCTALIDFMEDNRVLNNNHYFSNSLIGQTDGREKLTDGMFWSVLTFEFKHTT